MPAALDHLINLRSGHIHTDNAEYKWPAKPTDHIAAIAIHPYSFDITISKTFIKTAGNQETGIETKEKKAEKADCGKEQQVAKCWAVANYSEDKYPEVDQDGNYEISSGLPGEAH